jgi:outer membrane receptor protein involved in Fe transport
LLGSTALVTALILEAVSAAAQDPPDQDAPQQNILERITVTAQRREESVLTVPSSIEVFDSEKIEDLGITNIDDVVRLTPGLSAPLTTSILNTTHLTIRGIGSDISSSSIAVYVNDTPLQVRSIGDAQAADSLYPLVFDLARVEVLRGPQGTLFGSSAQGGAVRFITREAGEEWEGHSLLEFSHISDGELGYQAGVAGGGPISDNVGFRGSAYVQRVGGWIDFRPLKTNLIGTDLYPNRDDANSADNVALMATFDIEAADNFTITPSILWQQQEADGQNRFWRDFSSHGNYVNRDLFPATVDNEFFLASLNVVWELEHFDVYSTTSYLDRTRDSTADLSFGFAGFFGGDFTTPVASMLFAMENPQEQFTQEVRLQGVAFDDRLNWVVGGFYRDLDQVADFIELSPFFDDLLIAYFGFPSIIIFGEALVDGDKTVVEHDTSKDRELAFFGQLDYEIVPDWTLTGGLRFAKTENEGTISREGPLFATPGVIEIETSSEESVWLPKIGVKFEPSDDWMLYATASRGFRPGGGNVVPAIGLCASGLAALGLTDVPPDFDADFLNSYEVGVKGTTEDGGLALALSAFHSKWEDVQDSVSLGSCGLRYIDNLGSAISQGFEAQVVAAVTDGLELGLSAAYTDGYFEETIVIGTVPVVNEGDPLDTPPWKITGTVDYTFGQTEESEAYIHLDAQYASDYTLAVDPLSTFPEGSRRPSSLIASARLGLRVGPWDVSMFANNIFDSHKVLRSDLVAGQEIDTIATPRTIGLTVRSEF